MIEVGIDKCTGSPSPSLVKLLFVILLSRTRGLLLLMSAIIDAGVRGKRVLWDVTHSALKLPLRCITGKMRLAGSYD